MAFAGAVKQVQAEAKIAHDAGANEAGSIEWRSHAIDFELAANWLENAPRKGAACE
jgi:hypothetical protein